MAETSALPAPVMEISTSWAARSEARNLVAPVRLPMKRLTLPASVTFPAPLVSRANLSPLSWVASSSSAPLKSAPVNVGLADRDFYAMGGSDRIFELNSQDIALNYALDPRDQVFISR